MVLNRSLITNFHISYSQNLVAVYHEDATNRLVCVYDASFKISAASASLYCYYHNRLMLLAAVEHLLWCVCCSGDIP